MDIHRGGRAVCKSTGQNPGLRQGGGYPGVRWQVEGASRDGAGGGKAMAHGGEGERERELLGHFSPALEI